MNPRWQSHIGWLKREWADGRRQHPRMVLGVAAALALVAIMSIVGSIWFVLSLARGLPDMDALRRIGDMDQATAVYDASDRLVFTIYKEQRIEVPLDSVSPHMVRALLDVEDQR